MNDFILNKYSKISIVWRSIINQLQLEHKPKALKLLKILHTIKIDTTKFMYKSLLFLNLYYKSLKKNLTMVDWKNRLRNIVGALQRHALCRSPLCLLEEESSIRGTMLCWLRDSILTVPHRLECLNACFPAGGAVRNHWKVQSCSGDISLETGLPAYKDIFLLWPAANLLPHLPPWWVPNSSTITLP